MASRRKRSNRKGSEIDFSQSLICENPKFGFLKNRRAKLTKSKKINFSKKKYSFLSSSSIKNNLVNEMSIIEENTSTCKNQSLKNSYRITKGVQAEAGNVFNSPTNNRGFFKGKEDGTTEATTNAGYKSLGSKDFSTIREDRFSRKFSSNNENMIFDRPSTSNIDFLARKKIFLSPTLRKKKIEYTHTQGPEESETPLLINFGKRKKNDIFDILGHKKKKKSVMGSSQHNLFRRIPSSKKIFKDRYYKKHNFGRERSFKQNEARKSLKLQEI